MDAKGALHALFDIPTVVHGDGAVKSEVDAAGLARLLFLAVKPFHHGVRGAALERVWAQPGQGPSGTFSLGATFGCIRGVMCTLGYPLVYPAPITWKKKYGLTADKEKSRTLAISTWPTAELHLKRHADRAEALLLAKYAKAHGGF